MRRSLVWWITSIAAALAVGAAAGHDLGAHAAPRLLVGPSASAAQGMPARRAPAPPLVAVAHPQRASVSQTISLTGTVSSLRTAVLYPKVAGYLQTVTVRPGDPVTAGQVLAVIDHAQLEAQVAQAQASAQAAATAVQTAQDAAATAQAQTANAVAGRESARAALANAQAGVAKAAATLTDAQATERRVAALVQQGAEAQQALDDAVAQVAQDRASLTAAQAQVRAAQAQIAQAEAQIAAAVQQEASARSQVRTQDAQAAAQQAALSNARLGLDETTITAPFDGIVVSRSLDPGAYVAPGTSTPIVQIADLDQIDVLVNVTQAELSALRVGAPVAMQVDAYPGRTFAARVSRIAGGVDPTTRTVEAEIDVANPGHLLRPGMYATVALSGGAGTAVLTVPLSALATVGDQHFVWIVSGGVAHERQVAVGPAVGDGVEITSGLTETDLVVTKGIDLVREGQRVQTAAEGV